MKLNAKRKIYCCGCGHNVAARLTNGFEVYPRRVDLYQKKFWICDQCGNYVGCHPDTDSKGRPLGVIPTPEVRNARSHIHRILDPIWKEGWMTRRQVYDTLSERLGYRYHTANIKTVEEGRHVYQIIQGIRKELHDGYVKKKFSKNNAVSSERSGDRQGRQHYESVGAPRA